METRELIIGAVMLLALLAYAFHLLIFTYGWMKLGPRRPVAGFRLHTRVTVIVAMRDERENIDVLIRDLVAQDYPVDLFEVILVDDHSVDGTGERAERMIRQEGLANFRLLSLSERGLPGSKKQAIAAGVALAAGELIAVTDADCRPGRGWLRSLATEFENGGVKMVCGPVKPAPERSFSGMFRELEFLSLSGTGAGAIGAGRPVFCNGANMAFSREAFDEVGGYAGNERYASGDDVFLLHKIRDRYGSEAIGYVFDSKLAVETIMPAGWKGFLKQRIRWGSKTKGYRDFFSLTTALSVFTINLVMFLLMLSGMREHYHWYLFGYLFLMKMMLDFPILYGTARFFRREGLLWWFIPFEVIYVFYIVMVGCVSLFYGGSWKGRRV